MPEGLVLYVEDRRGLPVYQTNTKPAEPEQVQKGGQAILSFECSMTLPLYDSDGH